MVLTRRIGDNENGIAYDIAEIDVSPFKTLVLPDNATIIQSEETKVVRIKMAKTYQASFHAGPTSIYLERKKMGCAYRVTDAELTIATFGEWDTQIEGGARIELTLLIPKGIEFRQAKGLAGVVRHRGEKPRNSLILNDRNDLSKGLRFSNGDPADAWTLLVDRPNPQ